MTSSKAETLQELLQLCRQQRVPDDVALHAGMLVSNGWKAQEAIDESTRTLDDAELEGGY